MDDVLVDVMDVSRLDPKVSMFPLFSSLKTAAKAILEGVATLADSSWSAKPTLVSNNPLDIMGFFDRSCQFRLVSFQGGLLLLLLTRMNTQRTHKALMEMNHLRPHDHGTSLAYILC
jgi:hypothetical protein